MDEAILKEDNGIFGGGGGGGSNSEMKKKENPKEQRMPMAACQPDAQQD